MNIDIMLYPLFGRPLIVWGGIITFFLLIATASIPILNKKGLAKIPYAWHPRLAAVFIIMAALHAIFGMMLFKQLIIK